MAEENYAALYADAIAQSGSKSEILPDGEYNVKIATVKPDVTKAGKFKVGVRFDVLDGPLAGKSTWINQTFSPEGPKGAQSVGIFLRLMSELGVPSDAIKAGLPPATLIQYIIAGGTGVAKIGSHINGVNQDGTPKKWQDLNSFRLATAAAPAPLAAAPAPSAAPAPEVAAPAPEVAPAAPVAAPPLPVQAPPLPVQPGSPAPGTVPAPF